MIRNIIKSFLILILSLWSLCVMAQELDVFSKSNVKLITWNDLILSKWNVIDEDKDGKLTSSELGSISFVFRILTFKYFDLIDENKDGFIDKNELNNFSKEQEKNQKNKINKKWSKLDINKDFYISKDEAKEDKEVIKHFEEIDVNKDNLISVDELINFYNKELENKLF